MYHLELRQFPHNFSQFNLTPQALRDTILDAWARGEWVEVGERRWNPHQATLTVIEGPELPLEQLSMGRGWRAALRQGTNVTDQLLADARARLAPGEMGAPVAPPGGPHPAPGTVRSAWAAVVGPAPTPGPAPAPGSGSAHSGSAPGGSAPGKSHAGAQPAPEALALRLLSLLGEEPAPLLRAWQLALEQHPDRTPSQCLAAAEDFLRR